MEIWSLGFYELSCWVVGGGDEVREWRLKGEDLFVGQMRRGRVIYLREMIGKFARK